MAGRTTKTSKTDASETKAPEATETKSTKAAKATKNEEPKLLYETNDAISDVRIYAFNGHKFRIHCYHSNGEWSQTLAIMTDDGTWHIVENTSSLRLDWRNLYFLRGHKSTSETDLAKMKAQNAVVVDGFIAYIKAVYA